MALDLILGSLNRRAWGLLSGLRLFSIISFSLLSVLLSGCAVSGYANLAEQKQHSIERVQDYLNNLTNLQARFAQDGPGQGRQGDGIFYYKPGFLRLDYEVPHNMTMVAHDERLVLADPVVGSRTSLSLKHYPIGFLLRSPLDFSAEGVQVTDVRYGVNSLQISLAQANNPSQGLLTLQFSDVQGKLGLAGLQGVDAQHRYFGLSLFEQQEGQKFRDGLFDFPQLEK